MLVRDGKGSIVPVEMGMPKTTERVEDPTTSAETPSTTNQQLSDPKEIASWMISSTATPGLYEQVFGEYALW